MLLIETENAGGGREGARWKKILMIHPHTADKERTGETDVVRGVGDSKEMSAQLLRLPERG